MNLQSKSFPVIGMHCASCVAVIAKTLTKVAGVSDVQVNFATEKALIAYDPQQTSIVRLNELLLPLGYSLVDEGASVDTNLAVNKSLVDLADKVSFSLPIVVLVFILMLWDIATKSVLQVPNLPIPMPLLNPLLFILASVMLFWVGRPYLAGVTRFIRFRVANMDTLIGIGTLTAYLYSSFVLLFPQAFSLLTLPDHTYFDVTIVVLGLITLGKYLETRSKTKTGEALKQLIGLQAKTAFVMRGNHEYEIPIAEVMVGDLIVVKPGVKIPTDGVITQGITSIDESMITGESVPSDKQPNDTVIGGTINLQGLIIIRATKIGSTTVLAQIITMVDHAQGSKAPIQTLADKISAIFVPVVLLIAFASLLTWLTIGSVLLGTIAFSYGLLAFVSVLVIACPCALGLATPTAVIVGVGKGAQNGILVKDAAGLEQLSRVNTIVFDKTGTLTAGKPSVTDYISFSPNYDDKGILKLAASLEKYSQHPLAVAIHAKAQQLSLTQFRVTDFRETAGLGVEGVINHHKVTISKPGQSKDTNQSIEQLEKDGKTVVVVKENGLLVGCIAISDIVKAEIKGVIQKMHRLGIRTVMLTGDNQTTAKSVAESVGITEYRASTMPKDKANIIRSLQAEGSLVAMVGDGINDAPALTQADVGIALSTGTDIAIESSSITLLHGDIAKVLQAIKLAKATVKTIRLNLFWSFIYNIIGIPLAAGAFYPLFGILLNPVFAGLAMAFSSVSVVSNSLLLKRVRLSV